MYFTEWFEENRELLAELLRGDQEEALWLAWYAGYQKGLDDRANIEKEIWSVG